MIKRLLVVWLFFCGLVSHCAVIFTPRLGDGSVVAWSLIGSLVAAVVLERVVVSHAK